MYYWIVIDKALKTLRIIGSTGDECQANVENRLQQEYNMPTRMDTQNRFGLFFNGTKDYIDYNTFYKKYAKWKVIE